MVRFERNSFAQILFLLNQNNKYPLILRIMRKTNLLFFLILGVFVSSKAQEFEYLDVNKNDLDRLINQAITNSAELYMYDIQHGILNNQLKQTNSEHLGLFFIAGNLNEYSIQEIGGVENNINNFYPRYNIGVNLRLNHFSDVKNKKKIISQNQKIVLGESEITERNLITEVTKRYYEYLRAKKILRVKKTIEQFSVADFNSIETKFSEGDVELETYSSARKVFYTYKLQVIEAEENYIGAKLELEALINVSLESLGIQ